MESGNLNLGHRQRLKNRFTKAPSAVEDYELVELVLFNAIPRKDVKILAKILIKICGNFAGVINLDSAKLNEIALDAKIPIPSSIFTQFALIRESIRRSLLVSVKETIVLSTSSALNDYLVATMSGKDIENFRVMYLNTKNHLIADEVQEIGTIDQVHIYPREVLKRSLFYGAASIILVHNHPSGVAHPSRSDINLTNKIVEVCKSLDIAVHDHVIVGGQNVFSFRANGLL
ncbi:MAG: DNA repair protein RadC [Alphaproteobacteria bacterium]|nr:DNA repair protein RadC [Alphaproteobacteria bacterium]